MSEMSMNRAERLQIILTAEELAALDDWRFAHRMPTRAAAIRELMKRGMAVHLERDGASRVGRGSPGVRLGQRRPDGGNRPRADGASWRVRDKLCPSAAQRTGVGLHPYVQRPAW